MAFSNIENSESLGIINIAIVGNQIIIPPLSSDCDLTAIDRYIGVITFINQVFLNN